MALFSKCVIGTHLFFPKEEIENLEELRENLTFISRFDDMVRIQTYKESDSMFGVPINFFGFCGDIRSKLLSSNIVDKVVDLRTDGNIGINIKLKSRLWDYQENLVNKIMEKVRQGVTGFFVEAKPGSGKTVVGIALMCRLNRTALVVVPKIDLVHQWVERLVEHSSITKDEIATCYNGKLSSNFDTAKVTVGLVHTLRLDRFGETFRKRFGVVVYDEVDFSIPPSTFAPVASMFYARYRIGMTATRVRSDGLHKVFDKHLGQFKIAAESSRTMKPHVVQIFYPESSGYVAESIDFKYRRGQILSRIANNTNRNMLVAKYTYMAYESGRDVLVLSDRKDQLMELHSILTTIHNVPKKHIGYFVSSMKDRALRKEELKRTLEKCKIILGTYGMGSRGTDVQRLSALILATPHSNMTQISGRIERFLEGKQQPVIIDFVDTAYSDLVKSGQSRLNYYTKQKLHVDKVYI